MGHKKARMLYAHYREVVKEAADIEEFSAMLSKPVRTAEILSAITHALRRTPQAASRRSFV